jgi:hypothetical protein
MRADSRLGRMDDRSLHEAEEEEEKPLDSTAEVCPRRHLDFPELDK